MASIYLDYNATTPVAASVVAAMVEHLGASTAEGGWANVSTPFGAGAKAGLDLARARVATCLGAASPSEVVFCSGGTESINTVLRGVPVGGHIVASSIEHPATLQTLQDDVDRHPFTLVAPDATGTVTAEAVAAALRPDTVLVSVMLANNELGTVNPLAEIKAALPAGVLLHSDASQAVGKIPVRVQELGVDLLTVAGHKFYAPKGVGATYVRAGTPELRPLLTGGGQEGGRRAGTEPVAQYAALGEACRLVTENLDSYASHFREMRDSMRRLLEEGAGDRVRVNGHPTQVLPNTLSVSFEGVDARAVADAIAPRVVVSCAAACHKGASSYVLAAIGAPPGGALRISVGRSTTAEEVAEAAQLILAAAQPPTPTAKLYLEDSYLFNGQAALVRATEDTVVLDATLFHPQGGGQPADVGVIDFGSCRFQVEGVRCSPAGEVEHSGRFVSESSEPVERPQAGAAAQLRVDETARRLHARLHSAGHALDAAMSAVGHDMPGTKGFHFPGSPYVEYAGKLDAEARAGLPERLNAELARLVAEDIPTHVDMLSPEAPELEGQDLSHLGGQAAIRFVRVAGVQGCPCGGTHIKRSSDLGAVTVTKIKVKGGCTRVYYSLQ